MPEKGKNDEIETGELDARFDITMIRLDCCWRKATAEMVAAMGAAHSSH
jgi:hypothetical protein